MSKLARTRVRQKDIAGEWLVILMVIVALLAGWGVKSLAENQVSLYQMGNLSLAYPAGWSVSTSDGVTTFKDMRSGGAPPVIQIATIPIVAARPATQTLALEADALALSRAQELVAYRILEMDDTATLHGQPALRVSYVFVLDEPDAFEQHLPLVMLGKDLLTCQGDQVIVFSLQAAQAEFEQAQRHFHKLVDSARASR